MVYEHDVKIALILGIIFLLFNSIYILRKLEYLYAKMFHKPFFVHFYCFPKKLNKEQQGIISETFDFYRKLTPKRKKYFEHRVARFIMKYSFHGREELQITEEMKIVVAGTATMLTFGMRHIHFKVFDKIILFPDVYFSEQNNTFHKGEFNPKLKALVFSWKHFKEGLVVSNDNLNLGLHEFSHTLHFQSVKVKTVSGTIYLNNFRKLKQELINEKVKEKIINSAYFRTYAFTNEVEFIAVVLENFFETPEVFKEEFPQLYVHVKRMINYRAS